MTPWEDISQNMYHKRITSGFDSSRNILGKVCFDYAFEQIKDISDIVSSVSTTATCCRHLCPYQSKGQVFY